MRLQKHCILQKEKDDDKLRWAERGDALIATNLPAALFLFSLALVVGLVLSTQNSSLFLSAFGQIATSEPTNICGSIFLWKGEKWRRGLWKRLWIVIERRQCGDCTTHQPAVRVHFVTDFDCANSLFCHYIIFFHALAILTHSNCFSPLTMHSVNW